MITDVNIPIGANLTMIIIVLEYAEHPTDCLVLQPENHRQWAKVTSLSSTLG